MLLTKQFHNPKFVGWPLSNSELVLSISLSLRALEFKRIQRDTIALIVICTRFFHFCGKCKQGMNFKLNDRGSMSKKDNLMNKVWLKN